MTIIRQPSSLRDFLRKPKLISGTVGFVPTMGALHKGHIDLINRSAEVCDVTVCSIFVNPTQFNDPGDFKKYPIRLENDIRLLANSSADILFIPSVEDIYPAGTTNLEKYDLGYLETLLEGKYRPGHFQGVGLVISRLLNEVSPDYLFMGQKDYQQCMVVKKLLGLLSLPVTLITCETVREKDGLAMSSRNLRLSLEERSIAPLIYKTLVNIKGKLIPGDTRTVKDEAVQFLEHSGFKVDYVEIANADTLLTVDKWDGSVPLVVLIAAFLGEVRLIDNMLLNP